MDLLLAPVPPWHLLVSTLGRGRHGPVTLSTGPAPGSVTWVTVWIDPPAWPAHGRLWSHLVSDTSYAELHDFAAAQGIPARGFEGDHYDVPDERYDDLVAAGARPVGGRDLARILRDSGLRIPKRRHERVVRSTPDAPWLPPGSRADVITSSQDGPPAATVVVRLAVLGGDGVAVLERLDGGGLDLPAAPVGEHRVDELLDLLGRLVLGPGPQPPRRLVGYVRNTVPTPDDDYPWPVPRACFAVYAVRHQGGPLLAGSWLAASRAEDRLGKRHWWPLLAGELRL
jgi:Protein of unknown function (DUF4031)